MPRIGDTEPCEWVVRYDSWESHGDEGDYVRIVEGTTVHGKKVFMKGEYGNLGWWRSWKGATFTAPEPKIPWYKRWFNRKPQLPEAKVISE